MSMFNATQGPRTHLGIDIDVYAQLCVLFRKCAWIQDTEHLATSPNNGMAVCECPWCASPISLYVSCLVCGCTDVHDWVWDACLYVCAPLCVCVCAALCACVGVGCFRHFRIFCLMCVSVFVRVSVSAWQQWYIVEYLTWVSSVWWWWCVCVCLVYVSVWQWGV